MTQPKKGRQASSTQEEHMDLKNLSATSSFTVLSCQGSYAGTYLVMPTGSLCFRLRSQFPSQLLLGQTMHRRRRGCR